MTAAAAAPPPPPSFCPHGHNRARMVCGRCMLEHEKTQADPAKAELRASCPHAAKDVKVPALLVCRECGAPELERLDVRDRGLELHWRVRTFVHLLAAAPVAGDDPTDADEALSELREQLAGIVAQAKALDVELEAQAERVAIE